MQNLHNTAAGQGIDSRNSESGKHRNGGFALIVCLLLLVVFTMIAVTGLRSSVVEEMISGNQRLSASALFGAEQGVSDALDDMFDGTISDSGSESDINWSASGSTSGTGYSAAYTVSHLVRGGSQVEDDDGRRYFIIESTGQTTNGEAEREIEVGVALEWGASSNVAGLIGCEGVSSTSNFTTDSYSSSGATSDGDRGDVATTDPNVLMYLVGSSDFDVVGEVRSTGAIFMDSDALVRRDALANLRITVQSGDIYGSAYTNQNFYQCTSCVHGSIYQGPSVTPNPLVPYPTCDPLDIDAIFNTADDIKTSNNNGDIGMSSGANYFGSPDTLGGGTADYYFTNFEMDNDTVYISGTVRIYVQNDFTLKGDSRLILNANSSLKVYVEAGNAWIDSNSYVNHDPSNLFPNCSPGGCPINMWLYSKHTDTVKDWKLTSSYNEPNVWDDSQDVAGVKIDSNSVYYGIIYAPRSHVVMYSNSQIYGSVRGRFVSPDSNMGFHYDEDLDDIWTGNPTDYKLVYWIEQYPE